MAITTIIFDIGQVLGAFDFFGYLDRIGLDEEQKEKVFTATLKDMEHWDEHDRGTLSDEEFIQESLKRVPGIEKEMRAFFQNIHQMVREYDYAEKWVLDLKEAGYKVYILSNYGVTPFAYAREHFRFLKHVDGMVISSDVHYVKPELEIYQLLLDKYHLIPEECVFTDDREDNAAAAAAFGIHSIVFKNREQVLREMEALGVFI